jgi:hypothetical protein
VNPDPGTMEGYPASSTCMQCHANVAADSPSIRKLAEYYKNNRPVPWVRVYEIPDTVRFSHRAHLSAGSACENCHGKVQESERLVRSGAISMNACMDCHRARAISIECAFCHDEK